MKLQKGSEITIAMSGKDLPAQNISGRILSISDDAIEYEIDGSQGGRRTMECKPPMPKFKINQVIRCDLDLPTEFQVVTRRQWSEGKSCYEYQTDSYRQHPVSCYKKDHTFYNEDVFRTLNPSELGQ